MAMGRELEIRWHGRGGQGAKTAALLLADVAFKTGKHVQGFPEYGPERMGTPITAYHTKSEKAIYTEGASFLNIMAPCPRGWRYETSDIMKICKLAVETCYWPLFEVDHGKWKLS